MHKHLINYRPDIDGLRAVAVLGVILFHLGYWSNGYLGVDAFFVISGYLITKIIYKETQENIFSLKAFYLRRVRRILPLVLFTTIFALTIGLLFMLPNDLENLAHSVVATTFFSNNILEYITAKSYWAGSNEYDLLMHTWSLGVEEQFYFFYPLLFLWIGVKVKRLFPAILFLSIVSLFLFLFIGHGKGQFYFIQYRFFELSVGGLVAFKKVDRINMSWLKDFGLLILLLVFSSLIVLPNEILILITIAASSILMMPEDRKNSIVSFLLKNRGMIAVGKISFSLYMWHQIVFAFARYYLIDEITMYPALILVFVVFLLSVFSYYLIEQPFRDKKKIRDSVLLSGLGLGFAVLIGVSVYLIAIGGIIRDVPELSFYKTDRSLNDPLNSKVVDRHITYNSDVRNIRQGFNKESGVKILIIGNSFARDWANIIMESPYRDSSQIAYIENLRNTDSFREEIGNADVVFVSGYSRSVLKANFGFDESLMDKLWYIGAKNFGYNNGLVYAGRNRENYCTTRVDIKKEYLEQNERLKEEWKHKYIDIMTILADKQLTVPVFTTECEFISQDCIHLTKAGAKYLSSILPIRTYLNI